MISAEVKQIKVSVLPKILGKKVCYIVIVNGEEALTALQYKTARDYALKVIEELKLGVKQ